MADTHNEWPLVDRISVGNREGCVGCTLRDYLRHRGATDADMRSVEGSLIAHGVSGMSTEEIIAHFLYVLDLLR